MNYRDFIRLNMIGFCLKKSKFPFFILSFDYFSFYILILFIPLGIFLIIIIKINEFYLLYLYLVYYYYYSIIGKKFLKIYP
jgi:hypothetical protein